MCCFTFFDFVARDVFYQGTCDDGCQALADFIGWGVSILII